MRRAGPLAGLVLGLVLTVVGATPRCHHLRVNPEAPVQLGLLLPVHSSSAAGRPRRCDRTDPAAVQAYEAVRFALRRINQSRGQVDGRIVSDSFLPGVRLGVYVLDSCPLISDPVDHLLRCTAGKTRILGVIDGTAASDGPPAGSHPELAQLRIGRPHRLPPEERARAIAKFVLELGWRDLSVDGRLMTADDVLVVSLLESVVNSYSICLRGVVAVGELHGPDGAAGLAGVLVAAAPRRQDRAALLDRLPAPLYFVPSQPAAIGQLEKEWREMQSVTIPRLPSNAWFIQHAMDRLGCRLFNFTSSARGERRPICRNFDLSEDDLDRLERSRLALPAVHAVFTFANALFSAWQAECGNRPGSCQRLDRLSPAAFRRLYLDPLVFSHAAPGTR
ncbi:hypothetical protein FJT64_020440 [Amphibalanus amphitrite]|uniref:Receptor ligand binding region domain-containing protein n=1 Tax=Amphibalanus amphitrite TaxID=1232801 RepID=A0A6A4WQK6_AMPAM|nr:hypothetical protein FJT64_020440 [Amphibalanus amphitrite]